MCRFSLFLFVLFAHFPEYSYAAAIHDAAKKGDIPALVEALNSGATVNEDGPSGTALYIAARRGHLEAARLLIERGADVNLSGRRGPALIAALARNNPEMVRLLVEHGANPNAELDGEAALHVAVDLGCLDCVRALVTAGADVNAQSNEGKTPIHLAKLKGQSEIASYLVANGVKMPRPGKISGKLATADAEVGKAIFERECASCHSVEPQGRQKHGPNLWNVVGREKASVEQISYSESLRAWDGVWTYEDLNRFLSGPMLTTPGVYMEIKGILDEVDRANVIAYLQTLADKPVPLP